MDAEIGKLLRKHEIAGGVSIAVLAHDTVTSFAYGRSGRSSSRDDSSDLTPGHALQIASLSKTLATAFMLEYFVERRGVGVDDVPVNVLLREAGSGFQLRSAAGCQPAWADDVTLRHLVDHSSLGMHYVNGIPFETPGGMPDVLELISGCDERPAPFGYADLFVRKAPGSHFGYSGGGFLVLQHLLETLEGKPIAEIMAPFLAAAGDTVARGLSFHQRVDGWRYAVGFHDSGERVGGASSEEGRLMFPPLAAGGLGTPTALLEWLRQLALAYRRPGGCGGISHATARAMLTVGPDRGSEAFMRAGMGMGVFVFEAASRTGPTGETSKWMLHQAANDGYRGVFLVCFDGPDAADELGGPRGFVIISNGDNNAMFLNCAVARLLLRAEASRAVFRGPPIGGLDWRRVPSLDGGFSTSGLKQEEIVNLGLKELVLNAFLPVPSPRPRL